MKVSLDISVPSPLWRGLPRARATARETIAAAALESRGTAPIDRPERRASFQTSYGAVVSLCLADDASLRALNSRWRGIDKPTNVLSFPSESADRLGDAMMLGDIALAYETLTREAEDLGVPLADHYRHLLAHGFLHLIGYDHETDAEAERMEALETRILARLGAGDPYAREVIGG
jgi:probable rRNA maturation factor